MKLKNKKERNWPGYIFDTFNENGKVPSSFQPYGDFFTDFNTDKINLNINSHFEGILRFARTIQDPKDLESLKNILEKARLRITPEVRKHFNKGKKEAIEYLDEMIGKE